jgi:hypothetical protein
MPRRDRHRPDRRITRGPVHQIVVVLAATALSGCFVGERPTLIDRPDIDDPAAQAVIDRLGTAASSDFTATYEITPTLTNTATTATVVQSGTRRRVTVGEIAFLTDGTVNRTCTNDDRGCVDYIDDARISDLNITHRFWGDAFRARLELDASRRIGFSEPSDAMIAGAPLPASTCRCRAAPSWPGSSSTAPSTPVRWPATSAPMCGSSSSASRRPPPRTRSIPEHRAGDVRL